RDKRDFLRYKLKEYGYYQLQKSVWISFYPLPAKIKKIIKESDFADQVVFLKTKSLETKNTQELISKVFHLDKLILRYQKILEYLSNLKINKIPKIYHDRRGFWEFLKNEILTLFSLTPSLPQKLLPKELKEKMYQVKSLIKDVSKSI
ncbi:MAG: hypothetical protein ACK4FL_01730, partial [Microgenomates group bacterium]